jgi:hypothetical protein
LTPKRTSRSPNTSQTCVYPGIAQCFAIAGWTESGILCTHVSPGATKDDIASTFASLRDMGGSEVMYWYVVGPSAQHFAVAKAQWRSVKNIKETFKREFSNKTAVHSILDATAERNTKDHRSRLYHSQDFQWHRRSRGVPWMGEHGLVFLQGSQPEGEGVDSLQAGKIHPVLKTGGSVYFRYWSKAGKNLQKVDPAPVSNCLH